MSGISYSIDVETAHRIASAYLDRRNKGIQTITLGGDTANDVSWEIMLNTLEGKESNA